MTPAELAHSYDRIAERWQSADFDRHNGIGQHQRALTFAAASGLALDVGCGCSGRLIDLLSAHGFSVEGLDLSTEMLRRARLTHPNISFHHADLCDWQPSARYSFISAWDSLWHLPLAQQQPALLKLCAALQRKGVIIFSAGGTDSPEQRSDQAMGVPMYHATLGIPNILRVLGEGDCTLRHFEFDQPGHLHAYFIAQRN